MTPQLNFIFHLFQDRQSGRKVSSGGEDDKEVALWDLTKEPRKDKRLEASSRMELASRHMGGCGYK